MHRRRLFTVLLSAAGAFAATGNAHAFSAAAPPACESAVPSIVGRFEAYSPINAGRPMKIVAVSRIGQSRFEGRGETHPIERRYCRAAVVTDDGRKRHLWYLIESDRGFAGLGSSVEYCVSGLDRWYVYGASCKSLR